MTRKKGREVRWNLVDDAVAATLLARISPEHIVVDAPGNRWTVMHLGDKEVRDLVHRGFVHRWVAFTERGEFRWAELDGGNVGILDRFAVAAELDETWLRRLANLDLAQNPSSTFARALLAWLDAGMSLETWNRVRNAAEDLPEWPDEWVFVLTCAVEDGKSMQREMAMFLEEAFRQRDFQRMRLAAQVHARMLDDEAEARTLLNRTESEHGSLVDDAAAWKRGLGDDFNTRRCLLAAATRSTCGLAAAFISVEWLMLMGSEEQARRCLERGELHLECRPEHRDPIGDGTDVHDWIEMATAWRRLLSSIADVRRCLIRAEAFDVLHPSDWTEIARAWQRLTGHEEDVRRCLVRAEAEEENRLGSLFMADVARSWHELLGSKEDVRRCLARAEEAHSDSPSGLVKIAGHWQELAGAEEDVRRCLKRADETASSAFDFNEVGAAWMNRLGCEEDARRCLLRAEVNAEEWVRWIALAYAWKNVPGGEAHARRCIEKAESIPKAPATPDLGRAWMEILKSESDARRCLEKNETKCHSARGLAVMASHWQSILNSRTDARRCLMKAEEEAAFCRDWLAIAIQWQDLLGDKPRAWQCMAQAEATAEDHNWGRIAQMWRRLGSRRNARRCEAKWGRL